MLCAGTVLTEAHRAELIDAGMSHVYVDDELGEGIEVPQPLSARTRSEARAALGRAFAEASRMPGNLLSHGAMEDLKAAADRIVAEVLALGDDAFCFSDLAGPASYNVEHSIDATVVGLLIGRRLLDEDEDFSELGLGLFLQDIGKLALSPAVVQKPAPLGEDEWSLMQQHPALGLGFLRDDDIGARGRSIIGSHHERWDGSGYPDGARGTGISLFARIAAVADVFDAVTSERHYSNASPQAVGVDAIRQGAGSAFDPAVSAAFCEVVAPYPPGNEIELADGRRAVVVEPGFVRTLSGEEIDLSLHPQLG